LIWLYKKKEAETSSIPSFHISLFSISLGIQGAYVAQFSELIYILRKEIRIPLWSFNKTSRSNPRNRSALLYSSTYMVWDGRPTFAFDICVCLFVSSLEVGGGAKLLNGTYRRIRCCVC